jgi:pyruvate dehydrogenase E2 component (dihydrolipoamide acetyltransferase)
MGTGRVERLDYAERWLRDGLRVIDPPGGLVTVEVDMSSAIALKRRMKEAGTSITYTHLIVHAAARVLTEHPELHRLVAGNKRLHPDSVDICLSVAGEAVVTPVLIIKHAGNKSLVEIAAQIRECAAEAQQQDLRLADLLRRWGWIAPFGIVRRVLLRFFLGQLWYRRRASGTFQITVIPSVDFCAPFLFNTAAALSAGRVHDRVVPIEGRIEIRPMLVLACCIDHKVWNGMDAAKFLNGVKSNLEREIA